MEEKILIFFDLETTGLDADIDDVIEIGAIKTKDGLITEKFHSLVKPRKSVSRFITNLTGITEEELKNAKEAEEIKEVLNSFIKDYPLVAHNASFDKMFLEKLLARPLDNEVFDTLELSRVFFPDMFSHSLQNLVKRLSIKREDSHRALGDTAMLLSLFEKIIDEKKKFPKKLLKIIKEIIEETTDYTSLFGENWEDSENDEDFSLFTTYVPTRVVLPFREHPCLPSPFENGLFYADSPSYDDAINEVIRIANNGKKVVFSVYANEIMNYVEEKLERAGFNVARTEQTERLLCPKKIQYFMLHYDAVPLAFRAHFAILLSYIYKTKNLVLDNAPTHIIKNPIIRVLSSCDEPFETCPFKSQCPFFNKHSQIQSADIVLCNHQFILKDTFFNDALASRNLIFLDAFRLPKIIYNSKISYSYEELSMLSRFYSVKSEEEHLLKIIFDTFENTEMKDFSNGLESLKKIFEKYKNNSLKDFFERDTYFIDRRGSRTSIVGANETPKKAFIKINEIYPSIAFFAMKNKISERIILKEFTGIEGKFLTVGNPVEHKNVISIAPLYLPSSYNSTFVEEFLQFFLKVRRATAKVAIIFNQQTLLKEIYFSMKNRGLSPKAVGIDLIDESGEIEMFLYDHTPQNDYDEIYLVKLPSVQSENYVNESYEYFSALIARNVCELIVSKNDNPKVVFYFDSKLKRTDYRTTFEDLFVSFPLFFDREESIMRLLETWSKRHHNKE